LLFTLRRLIGNVVRDDADTIQRAHESDFATNSLILVYIKILRNANRLAESEVTQKEIGVGSQLAGVSPIKTFAGFVVVESGNHDQRHDCKDCCENL